MSCLELAENEPNFDFQITLAAHLFCSWASEVNSNRQFFKKSWSFVFKWRERHSNSKMAVAHKQQLWRLTLKAWPVLWRPA